MNREYITFDDLDTIINNIYINEIPSDTISDIINYFINKKKISLIYKVYGLTIKNNLKIKSTSDSDFIYEYICYTCNYSPLLRYYDKQNIKYEQQLNVIEKNFENLNKNNIEFNKNQLIKNFKFSNENFDENIKFLINNELKLYEFINNLIEYNYDTWKIFLNINKNFTMNDLTFLDDCLIIKDITKKEWNIKYKNKKCKIFLY